MGNLAKTGSDTANAVKKGDVKGTASGLGKGVGNTVGGAGKGAGDTVSGAGKGLEGTVGGVGKNVGGGFLTSELRWGREGRGGLC